LFAISRLKATVGESLLQISYQIFYITDEFLRQNISNGGDTKMDILIWIILGLVAGYLASLFMKTDASQGPLMDIILGIVGALVGGFLMNLVGNSGVTGFNIYSIFVATFGAIVLIALRRALIR
jgi:uncharacterized membrane protein YeaQ/YmgE (transglycosylase-associated protein family)